jgi:hypothetical protein
MPDRWGIAGIRQTVPFCSWLIYQPEYAALISANTELSTPTALTDGVEAFARPFS